MTIELSYLEQKGVIADNIWFDVLITFWNDDNDLIKEHSFQTQYPGAYDICDTLEAHGEMDLKNYGGDFDNYEVTKVTKISK
jgi:hypothetical protein